MLEEERKRKRLNKVTPREQEVLLLLLQGHTNKDIAQRLGISDYTARDHVSALLRKNEVRNRAQLIALHITAPRKKKLLTPLHLTDCSVER
ncbi:LuxR C-terminal-related transcriptional regulator [Pseudomonas petrae]|uniref:LuxR C-terminal-related transcriptional regulator n=1 Tax=Pseudomonas petrae TaxID=2912190 RepID=A0ABS9IBG9_9PSED|nr:LuxR C-terminal-related transcriptional regulator [Pseudomonas petrae]MCF7535461.1 LuxR C-terminal-related transcriptional regulator [Pseudomonas petrae]MCF7540347.1 LuxR C-terminal-related transcriptional regulator [Pseudomonas petrae]MCF7545060.1 LuxR C-terminal-related transcriptional regulator [Pseudomonas petrae]MCF7558802.1 LuxR C-terminal-related transcriptional regulator [Pseudomonas petrae]